MLENFLFLPLIYFLLFHVDSLPLKNLSSIQLRFYYWPILNIVVHHILNSTCNYIIELFIWFKKSYKVFNDTEEGGSGNKRLGELQNMVKYTKGYIRGSD